MDSEERAYREYQDYNDYTDYHNYQASVGAGNNPDTSSGLQYMVGNQEPGSSVRLASTGTSQTLEQSSETSGSFQQEGAPSVPVRPIPKGGFHAPMDRELGTRRPYGGLDPGNIPMGESSGSVYHPVKPGMANAAIRLANQTIENINTGLQKALDAPVIGTLLHGLGTAILETSRPIVKAVSGKEPEEIPQAVEQHWTQMSGNPELGHLMGSIAQWTIAQPTGFALSGLGGMVTGAVKGFRTGAAIPKGEIVAPEGKAAPKSGVSTTTKPLLYNEAGIDNKPASPFFTMKAGDETMYTSKTPDVSFMGEIKPGETAHVTSIMAETSGTGAGTRMLGSFEQEARGQGSKAIGLEAAPESEAYFAKNGYSRTGGADANGNIPMAKDLVDVPKAPPIAPVADLPPTQHFEAAANIAGKARLQSTWDSWRDWWTVQDRAVIKEVPESPVILSMDAGKTLADNKTDAFLNGKLYADVKGHTDIEIKQIEHDVVKTAKAARDLGMSEMDAYGRGLQNAPQWWRQIVWDQEVKFRGLNDQLREAGLPVIPRDPYPHWPRQSTAEWKEANLINRSMTGFGGNALSTTLKGMGQKRAYDTMLEGESIGGIEYVSPKRSLLWHDNLVNQAKWSLDYRNELRAKGVIHDTREGAYVAGKAVKATTEPMSLRNFPTFGEGETWVRTTSEGKWLQQNLADSPRSSLDALNYWYTMSIRNPGLILPYPHGKNMITKYGVSGGDMVKLAPYWNEYAATVDPTITTVAKPNRVLVNQFERFFPRPAGGQVMAARIEQAVPMTRETITGPALASRIGSANKWSSEKIFKDWDPAIRYAFWKDDLSKTLSPEAFSAMERGEITPYIDRQMTISANKAGQALIRYPDRSGRLDFLRSLPGNVFVTWRTSAIRTTLRVISENPGKALTFVAAMDYLNEYDRAKHGMQTHMFWRYIETPVAQLATMPLRYGQTAKAMAAVAQTLTAGTGGDMFRRNVEMMISAMKADSGETWKQFQRSMLVLATANNLVDEGKRIIHGDVTAVPDLLLSLLVNRHVAIGEQDDAFGVLRKYSQAITGKDLIEYIPGLKESPLVATGTAADRANKEASRVLDQIAEKKKNAMEQGLSHLPPVERQVLQKTRTADYKLNKLGSQ